MGRRQFDLRRRPSSSAVPLRGRSRESPLGLVIGAEPVSQAVNVLAPGACSPLRPGVGSTSQRSTASGV